MARRYKVEQGINCWYVRDNQTNNQIARTCATRKEARRVAVGMNAGWIPNEVEKEAGGDTSASGEAR